MAEPQVRVKIQVRDRSGRIYYVSTLAEAIEALVDAKGYKVSIYGTSSRHDAIVVRRSADGRLVANVHGPGLSPLPPIGHIETEEEFDCEKLKIVTEHERRTTIPAFVDIGYEDEEGENEPK